MATVEMIEHETLRQMSIPTAKLIADFESRRPDYVVYEQLLSRYPCGVCKDIPVRACQTPCGNRVCTKCIEEKFGDSEVIPCPLSHDDMDDDDPEDCQKFGLKRGDVTIDHSVRNILLRQSCFCTNQLYGCRETPQAKKLLEHERVCRFYPHQCPNNGCTEELASHDLSIHVQTCQFAMVQCKYCQTPCRFRDLEEHYGDCEFAESLCTNCNTKYEKRKHLLVHQKTNPECLAYTGLCFYHSYCGFASDNIEELQNHLRTNISKHLETLTVKITDMEQALFKANESHEKGMKQAVLKKVLPLEKVAADIAMKVKKVETKLEASETNADHLVNAMRAVAHSSQQIESVQSRVAQIERQIRESGLDRVTVIESHTQNIKRHADQIAEADKRLKNVENGTFDGTLIWKISSYKRRKEDAVRGRQLSFYSSPFYTSKCGYKMCCRAYLNGDGLGRGKCLSLFFVVMRGEYDELLTFPFRQRVTFSLLCPSNPSLSKHETFLPDPDSSSFRRPQTDMNIASGCPQFAPHGDVESGTFNISDSIYIRVRVEPGGDVIP